MRPVPRPLGTWEKLFDEEARGGVIARSICGDAVRTLRPGSSKTGAAPGLEEAVRFDRPAGRQTMQARLLEASVIELVFDSRPERHLVRIPAWVDEQGWRELGERFDLTLEDRLAIEARAPACLETLGDEAEKIAAWIYLAFFEAAPGAED